MERVLRRLALTHHQARRLHLRRCRRKPSVKRWERMSGRVGSQLPEPVLPILLRGGPAYPPNHPPEAPKPVHQAPGRWHRRPRRLKANLLTRGKNSPFRAARERSVCGLSSPDGLQIGRGGSDDARPSRWFIAIAFRQVTPCGWVIHRCHLGLPVGELDQRPHPRPLTPVSRSRYRSSPISSAHAHGFAMRFALADPTGRFSLSWVGVSTRYRAPPRLRRCGLIAPSAGHPLGRFADTPVGAQARRRPRSPARQALHRSLLATVHLAPTSAS